MKTATAEAIRRAETHLISEVLALHGGNKTKTARALGISYRALLYKMKDYGI